MEKQVVDGVLFTDMLRAGAANLCAYAQAINNLNVFPIPDGDTGDNMVLTIMGGVNALGVENPSVSEVAKQAADGMLLSARGNSGVILSQLFAGIAEGLEGLKDADTMQLGNALQCGVRHAYNAVIEPTEGTILTVAKNAANYTESRVSNSVEEFIGDYLTEARRTLERTPDMLPVLKRAGVVDSGGAGLVYIVEGAAKALSGEMELPELHSYKFQDTHDVNINLFTEDSILEYGYCTELLLRLQRSKTDTEHFDVTIIADYLKKIGDSVVAFKTGSIIKIHVHTMTPDKVLRYCQKYGEFLKVKIENMSLQHNNTMLDRIKITASPESERKAYGVVAVCAGEGIKQMFLDRGADQIVDGGQSMNPSTQDFLEAFRKINAETILVLPNNGNVILSAQQAAKIYPGADVRVIESKTIGDGYTALSMLNPAVDNVNEMIDDMECAMQGVITAEVSQCVRDANILDAQVHSGDYIGFAGKEILAASNDRLDAVCATVDRLGPAGYDICILICGSAPSEEEAERAEAYIRFHYPDKEIYRIDGKQEIYDYILILE